MGSYRHLCCIYSRLRLVPFASLRGRIFVWLWEFFIISPCRHGLAATSQTVSVGHERNEQPKGKPRTSWRLLRRLIGESRDPCRFVSYGTLAGCQYSNRACLANPINLLFVEPWVWIWKSFRARPKFHVLILLLPRNIPIRLFLSASRTYNLPVQAFIRSIL